MVETLAQAGEIDEKYLQLCAATGFELKAMENKPSESRELLWRRKLSAAERAALRGQPDLELEAQLTAALEKIPVAPVPSNFTARLFETIELEEKSAARSRWRWNWRSLFPRVAVATAVLVIAGVGIQRYETHSQRAALAKNVALLAVTQPLPSVDALENLDAIQRLSQSSHADGELLAALQ